MLSNFETFDAIKSQKKRINDLKKYFSSNGFKGSSLSAIIGSINNEKKFCLFVKNWEEISNCFLMPSELWKEIGLLLVKFGLSLSMTNDLKFVKNVIDNCATDSAIEIFEKILSKNTEIDQDLIESLIKSHGSHNNKIWELVLDFLFEQSDENDNIITKFLIKRSTIPLKDSKEFLNIYCKKYEKKFGKEFTKLDEKSLKNTENLYETIISVFNWKLSKIRKETPLEDKVFHWKCFLDTLSQSNLSKYSLITDYYNEAFKTTNYPMDLINSFCDVSKSRNKCPSKILEKAVINTRSLSISNLYLSELEKSKESFSEIRTKIVKLISDKNFFRSCETCIYLVLFLSLLKVREFRVSKENDKEKLKKTIREEFSSLHKYSLDLLEEGEKIQSVLDAFKFFSFVELRDFNNVRNARNWLINALDYSPERIDLQIKKIRFEKTHGSLETCLSDISTYLKRHLKSQQKENILSIVQEWKTVVWDCYVDVDCVNEDMSKINKLENDCKPRKNEKINKTLKAVQTKVDSKGKINKNQLNEDRPNTTAFVVNIPRSTDEKELRTLFSHYGPLISIKLPKNEQGQPKGYCYITFRDQESLEKAIKELNLIKFKNQILSVQHTRSQNSHLTVFVKNIPPIECNKEISAIFSKCGEISEIRRPKERREERPKSFCYITFTDNSSATKALELNGVELKTGGFRRNLRVEKCLPAGVNDGHQNPPEKENNATKKIKRKGNLFVPSTVTKKNLSNKEFSKLLQ